jgi:hypothetical protein
MFENWGKVKKQLPSSRRRSHDIKAGPNFVGQREFRYFGTKRVRKDCFLLKLRMRKDESE